MSIADIILYIHDDDVSNIAELKVQAGYDAHALSTALEEDPDPFLILWSVLVNKTAPR
jgi:Tfp pilus assembly pilus retraction ATPase PilT